MVMNSTHANRDSTTLKAAASEPRAPLFQMGTVSIMQRSTSGSSSIQGTTAVMTLFERRFVVPGYQRVFDWGYMEIKALLSDLHAHAESSQVDVNDMPDYLLNSILTLDTGSELELIDGQQRITALTVLFAATRDVAKEFGLLGDSYIQTLDSFVAVKDGDVVVPRMRDQYPSGPAQEFLNQIACGVPKEVQKDSPAYPLYRCYKQIESWVRLTFGAGVDGTPLPSQPLARFLDVVRKRARFAEICVASSAVAWRAFERANDRGKPLSVADRVKSDLFNLASDDSERSLVADHWRLMLDSLRRCHTNPDTFLHHTALSDLAEAKVSRSGVREVLRNHTRGGQTSASDMAKNLASAAAAYAQILGGRVPKTGEECIPLLDMDRVPRLRRVVQARPALLAARHLDADVFRGVAQELERFVVVVVLTAQRGQDYEKELFEIAKMLRPGVADEKTIVKDLREHVTKLLSPAARSEAFVKVLEGAKRDSLGHEMTQYLLARAETFLRDTANAGTARVKMKDLVGRANHVEHILPQSLPASVVTAFGPRSEAERLVEALGNLTIWEGSQNSALQDSRFEEKQSEYAVSGFKLTKALGASLGSAGGNKKLADQLSMPTSWDVQALERRHRELGAILAAGMLGTPSTVKCGVLSGPKSFETVPYFPKPSHLTSVLIGVDKGLRTPTDLVSVVPGVNTPGVINQALAALVHLDLVFRQEGSCELSDLGRAVCSEDSGQIAVEIAKLITADDELLECARSSGPDSSVKVKSVAKAVSWARKALVAE